MLDPPRFLSQPPPASKPMKALVEAVAVWDTVGAFGTSTYLLQAERIEMGRA